MKIEDSTGIYGSTEEEDSLYSLYCLSVVRLGVLQVSEG